MLSLTLLLPLLHLLPLAAGGVAPAAAVHPFTPLLLLLLEFLC
jgi:hypothetical protein